MGFQEAVVSVLNNYATFTGRARRSEYWYFALFNALVGAAIGVVGALFQNDTLANALSALFALAMLLPNISVSIRRMHDIGKSGWSLLFSLIPVIGWILLLIWECRDSEPGANQYGPNPKENAFSA